MNSTSVKPGSVTVPAITHFFAESHPPTSRCWSSEGRKHRSTPTWPGGSWRVSSYSPLLCTSSAWSFTKTGAEDLTRATLNCSFLKAVNSTNKKGASLTRLFDYQESCRRAANSTDKPAPSSSSQSTLPYACARNCARHPRPDR